MVSAKSVIYYLFHPDELRSIIQWYTWHDPVHQRNEKKEDETTKECFKYLLLTSRSFAAVIQELHPELLIPVTVFYLVLRGLDTVEDDTSIPAKTKEPILRGFHDNLDVEGWHYDGNRPEEKDRELLVNFFHVTKEFKRMKPAYQVIIKDICEKMGNGMADFCLNADINKFGVDKVADYELYCWYVAGLVGEGCTRMFVESKFGNNKLLEKPELYRSMGLFLQKTNIIRDIREDFDDGRIFYPREIWSKHVDKFEDLFKPENKEKALNLSSEMVLNALQHADECLFYLAGLREQSVFNFCAIPQSMAIATLELCFRNPALFQRNVKVTKGHACQLMLESTQNLELVCAVFKKHVRAIRKKNRPQDPNFLKISIACGKIEQFIESLFPTQKLEDVIARSEAQKTGKAMKPTKAEEDSSETFWLFAAVFGMMILMAALMFGIAYLFGARWDRAFDAFDEIYALLFKSNQSTVLSPADAPLSEGKLGHSEL